MSLVKIPPVVSIPGDRGATSEAGRVKEKRRTATKLFIEAVGVMLGLMQLKPRRSEKFAGTLYLLIIIDAIAD